jgi:hypothetical protein
MRDGRFLQRYQPVVAVCILDTQRGEPMVRPPSTRRKAHFSWFFGHLGDGFDVPDPDRLNDLGNGSTKPRSGKRQGETPAAVAGGDRRRSRPNWLARYWSGVDWDGDRLAVGHFGSHRPVF